MNPRHLAITMGDPAGIGPEIIAKACQKLKARIDAGGLRLLIIGSGPALERARTQLDELIEIPTVSEEEEWPDLGFLQAGPEGEPIEPGRLSADGGRLAFLAVERGVRLATNGRVGGIVTAPLNKEALNNAGYHYPGHTEMIAELTGVREPVMMLAHGNMRVSHGIRALSFWQAFAMISGPIPAGSPIVIARCRRFMIQALSKARPFRSMRSRQSSSPPKCPDLDTTSTPSHRPPRMRERGSPGSISP